MGTCSTYLQPWTYHSRQDEKVKQFGFDIVQDAFLQCDNTTEFLTGWKDFFTLSNLCYYCAMPNLQSIVLVNRNVKAIGQFYWLTKPLSDKELSVVINQSKYGNIEELLAFCTSISKNPSLYIIPTKETTDLCEFVKTNVRKVYICGDSSSKQRLTTQSDIESCPFLTHLCLMQMVIDERILAILSKAVKECHLPLLSHLSFEGMWWCSERKIFQSFSSQNGHHWLILVWKDVTLMRVTYRHLF